MLVEHIHSLGAKAKLHICGDTSAILPDMIASGADIIDVDHLVPSVTPFVSLLAPHQVFSGKADPVSVMQNGSSDPITTAVRRMVGESNGRSIVYAGSCAAVAVVSTLLLYFTWYIPLRREELERSKPPSR
jgi:uroporphyrinogen-III decarboxylase